MTVRRGEVVMVDWHFSDRRGVKTRPRWWFSPTC
jgi:hypothetical protein